MQTVFHRDVENTVSKTVNLPHTATRRDIEDLFLLAHELGSKGITVFRQGCKGEQVLRAGEWGENAPVGVQACPECGGRMVEASASVACLSCGHALCTI